MPRQWRIFVVLLIASLPAFAQRQPSGYQEKLGIIDAWLNAQRDFDHLPGLSVAIVSDQQIIFQKGYGYADVSEKKPMTPETVCSICSISKLFTSIAVMQLYEQGRLRLDDSLSSLLPEYRINQTNASSLPITIRSMLTHSSGLTRDTDSTWNGPNYYFFDDNEVRGFLARTHTLYPASTYFQYSNLAMSLLGTVVARKSALSYDRYVEEHILKPLKLNETHPFLPRRGSVNALATGYGAINRFGFRTVQPRFATQAITPAAGFSSTVLDLAKFAEWQLRLNDKDTFDVIHSASLKEMQRTQWTSIDKKITWGLGFRVEYNAKGLVTIGHDGSCPGFESIVMIDRKHKLGVTLMINAQGVDIYKYSDQIFNLLNDDSQPEATDPAADLTAYAGNFDNYDWSGEIVVRPLKGRLVLFGVPSENPGEGMSKFKFIQKDTFRLVRPDDQTLGEPLIFERDSRGQISGLRWFSRRMKKID